MYVTDFHTFMQGFSDMAHAEDYFVSHTIDSMMKCTQYKQVIDLRPSKYWHIRMSETKQKQTELTLGHPHPFTMKWESSTILIVPNSQSDREAYKSKVCNELRVCPHLYSDLIREISGYIDGSMAMADCMKLGTIYHKTRVDQSILDLPMSEWIVWLDAFEKVMFFYDAYQVCEYYDRPRRKVLYPELTISFNYRKRVKAIHWKTGVEYDLEKFTKQELYAMIVKDRESFYVYYKDMSDKQRMAKCQQNELSILEAIQTYLR